MKRLRTVALAFLSLMALQVGIWAQFAPHSFYRSFPGSGRRWIGADGPYNEHLIRDVGGLNLALAALTIAALVWKSQHLVRISGIAWLIYSAPHVIYHAAHTERLNSTSDQVVSVGFLAIFALLGAALAVAPRQRSTTDSLPVAATER